MLKIYKTDYGIFSIIQDSKLFNNVLALKADKRYTIPEVQNIISLIPAVTPISVSKPSTYVFDGNTLANVRETFKGTYINERDIGSNTTQEHTYSFSDSKKIKVRETTDKHHSFTVDTFFTSDNFTTDFGTGFFWPYGYGDTYSTFDNKLNVIYAGILVFNDDSTDVCNITIIESQNNLTISTSKSFQNDTARKQKIINFFSDIKPHDVVTQDPYTNGGNSTGAGGGGTFGGGNTIFGGASDSIDIPPLPTASASAAGFITLFNPTLGQLNNLASYMWSDLFSLDTFKKIFADPMDCILGLSIVPVKPASAGTSAVKIGNVSTDVSMNKTSSQYVAVDCGTIDVKEYWGAYLDYAPYTQCEIYLPYVGTKQISVDDVMNKSVHVVYHVDILSGACNAYVKCGDSVLYAFVGQCSSSIPISGNDWTNVLNGAISVAGKIGLAMATGGATALMSGLGAASSIISSSKPTVERSGAMSSTGGLLGIQKPYLILTRPKQALPENQNKYTGYPSFITMALSDCTGYTEIDSIHLENMSCTDEEAQEIENLLKSGVIF